MWVSSAVVIDSYEVQRYAETCPWPANAWPELGCVQFRLFEFIKTQCLKFLNQSNLLKVIFLLRLFVRMSPFKKKGKYTAIRKTFVFRNFMVGFFQ